MNRKRVSLLPLLLIFLSAFIALITTTNTAQGQLSHGACLPGEPSFFGFLLDWYHIGNDPEYPGILEITMYLPKYTSFLHDFGFNVSVEVGSLIGYEWNCAPNYATDGDYPGELFPNLIYCRFRAPPSTFIKFGFSFYLQIDLDVPCEYEEIQRVCEGKLIQHVWYRDANNRLIYRTQQQSLTGITWPIIWPRLSLDPNAAAIGDRVYVYGHNFSPNANAQIFFNETSVASVKANSDGWFATSFIVPETASLGTHIVSATSDLDRCVKPAILAVKHGYKITMQANPDKLFSDGVSTSIITVKVQDKKGNPVAGDKVIIGIDYAAPGSLEGSSSVERVTGQDGTVTVIYKAPTIEEVHSYFGYHVDKFSVTISALETIDGAKASTNITLGQEIVCSLEAKPSMVAANGWGFTIVTATIKTAEGVPLQGKTVEFYGSNVIHLETPGGKDWAVAKTTGADGKALAYYFAPTPEEYEKYFGDNPTTVLTITARFFISNYSSIEKSVDITISKKFVLTVEAKPEKLYLSDKEEKAKITVALKDEYGEPASDTLVKFSLEPNIGRLEYSEKYTEFDGKAIVEYTAPTAEEFSKLYPDSSGCNVTLTATVKDGYDNSYMASAKITLMLKKYSLAILADPDKLYADGKSESTILVTLKEEFKPAPYKEVYLKFSPDFRAESGLYYTNEHGIIRFKLQAPNLNAYISAGLPRSITVSANFEGEEEEVDETKDIALSGLKIWAWWPKGAVIPWEEYYVKIKMGVIVTLADGTPVQNAHVKVYGARIGIEPIKEGKTDSYGIALLTWDYVHDSRDPYTEPKMLSYQVVVTANFDGIKMTESQNMIMAIGARSNWMDLMPNEFWDRVGNEIRDAIGALPGLPDLPDWSLTYASIIQRIEVIMDPDARGSDKWLALNGILGDLSTQIIDEAGLDLAWYVAEKINVIINDWGANWVFVEDYFKWKEREEPLPPIPGNNGADTSPNAEINFQCPINVLIIDTLGNMIGNAATSATQTHIVNDMWLNAYYDEERQLEHQYFKLYGMADGLYLIRIVGTDNGAYDYKITFEWLGRTFTVEDSGNISLGETQWKFMLINCSDNVEPVRIFGKNYIVQSCDLNGIVKNYFKQGETVYVFGRNLQAYKTLNLYVLSHSALAENTLLPGTPVSIGTDSEGNINVTPIVTGFLDFGRYDIVLDVNSDGRFNAAIDVTDPTGFFIVRTLTVPDDYGTIQAAIDAANCGDTIYIKSGIYNENVYFNFNGDKRDVSIIGEDKFTTVLNGTLSLWPQNPEGIFISSLTIKGGNGALHSAAPFTLTNCIVKDNINIWSPFSSSLSFIIEDNIIEGDLCFSPDGNVPLHNIIVQNNLFLNHGITLLGYYGSYANSIINNTIINAWIGVAEIAPYPDNPGFTENVIMGNYIIGCWSGIQCFAEDMPGWYNKQSRTNITRNTLVLNDHGIWIERVIGTRIWHNNFINNTIVQVGGGPELNIWDDGYPSGGNYWSNYMGVDLYSGPYQDETGSDGVGDTPYFPEIGGGNMDRYPLMNPLADVTVTFEQTGVAYDFEGTVLMVDGQSYTVKDFPVKLKWNKGQKHIFKYHSPLTVLADSKLYNWIDTMGLSTKQTDIITLSESGTITANYKKQYLVTFTQTGLDNTASGTVVTINGDAKTYGNLPFTIWVDESSIVTYTYGDIVSSTSSGKQFRLDNVTGPASPITVLGPVTVTGNYKTQYLLTVVTDPSGLSPQPTRNPPGELGPANSWWYDADTSVQLTAESVSGYTFSNWEVDDASQGAGVNPITVNMDASHTAIAYYTTAGPDTVTITFSQSDVGSDFTGIVLQVDGNNYYVADLPASFMWNIDSSHTFSYYSPLEVDAAKRYVWTSTTGLSTMQSGTIIASASGSVTGNYGVQWRVNFTQTGLDSDAGSNAVLTLQGNNYAWNALPSNIWVDDGATFSWADSVTVSTNEQFAKTVQTGSSPVNAAGTYSATYQKQWLVTFKQTGSDVAPKVKYRIDSGPALQGTVEFSVWVDDCLSIEYSYESPVAGAAGTRYFLTGTSPDSPQTVNSAIEVTGAYKTQYYVTFNQNGLDSTATGTIVMVGGTPITMADLLCSDWFDSTITYTFSDPVSSSVSGKRFSLTSVTGIFGPGGMVTGNYHTEYYVTFTQSGLDDTATGKVLTINGDIKVKSDLPYQDWFDSGTTYIYEDVVSSSTVGKRFKLVDVAGPASPISESGTVQGNYKTQYLLTVVTDPAGLSPQPTRNPAGGAASPNSWWYDATTSVTLTAQPVTGLEFNYWDVDGSSQGSGVNPITVQMNAPHTATAHYTGFDNTPPSTKITVGEPKYVSGIVYYVTSETLFTLMADDGEGSGFCSTAYRIQGSTYDSGWKPYTGSFSLMSLANGAYIISFNSTDNAGNVETTKSIQVTLFSWNYIFADTYGRGTTLKINLAYKLFQFITPNKDYGIRKATYMQQIGTTIVINHCDKELILATVAMDTNLDYCYAVAWDLKTRKQYLLIDKIGKE